MAFILIAFVYSGANAQFGIDLEAGYISTVYNDVRIPGDQGTLFSLNKDLEAEGKAFYRIRISYTINSRHIVSGLFAPLTIRSDGSVSKEVNFAGEVFPANTIMDADYKFNSYRLTYRYDFIQKPKLDFGAGLTGKIRDARIALKSQGLAGEKINIGFVPLINFRLLWKPFDKLNFLLEGDALAAPQGRAEDVLAAVTYKISDIVTMKAGYRFLEGGADNDEVYTFSMFNYASAGLVFEF